MSEMSLLGGVITVNYLVVAVNVILGANASNLFFLFHSLLGSIPPRFSLLTPAFLVHWNFISIYNLLVSYPLPHPR